MEQQELKLTEDVVAHLQRIADRSGDKLLKETSNHARSALAKGINAAQGVHLTRITQEQARELVNLAIQTQDHELADFARYCQSVADSSGIGIEPSPGKIEAEINKGRKELQQRGRVHTGPGYGAAFASTGQLQGGIQQTGQQQVSQQHGGQQQATQPQAGQSQAGQSQAGQSQAGPGQLPGIQRQGGQQGAQRGQQGQQDLKLTISQVAQIMCIADRTGDAMLKETASRAHSAFARGLSDDPNVHLTWITHDQANELVQIAIRTQDRELADFARYCQSVAATTGVGLEPTPGKIQQELERGRQELAQSGVKHTGPGYGAAFGSVGQQQGGKQGARQQGGQQGGQKAGEKQQPQQAQPQYQPGIDQSGPQSSKQPHLTQQRAQETAGTPGILQPGIDQTGFTWKTTDLKLTTEVVAQIQRLADRTGNELLKETANRACSACKRGTEEGVNLAWVTAEEATKIVNLATQTQDMELADFALYCQSAAQVTGVAIEPAKGKTKDELDKGEREQQDKGRVRLVQATDPFGGTTQHKLIV